MLKVFKILVTGLGGESAEEVGRNLNYTTSMGYNEQTKEIRVLVEKVVLPQIGTETVDLRGQPTTATYETVAERIFKESDFPQSKEYMKWVVEFDTTTETISDPINVLEMTKNYINNSLTDRRIPAIIQGRYGWDLIPLFALDQFYKNAPGFDGAVLTFYDDQSGNDLQNATIEYQDAQEVTQIEKETWFSSFVKRHIHYEILDNDGKILSTVLLTNTKPEAKSANFIETEMLGLAEENTYDVIKEGGERYKINLPAELAGTIKVRVVFSGILFQISEKAAELHRTVSQTYDVTCINGVVNKNRLVSTGSYDESTQEAAASFIAQHNPRPGTGRQHLNSFENITITTTDLVAGDFVKLKLNLGDFVSYSELWVQLV